MSTGKKKGADAVDLIKEKNKRKLLKEAKKLRTQMKGDVESAKIIREDRND